MVASNCSWASSRSVATMVKPSARMASHRLPIGTMFWCWGWNHGPHQPLSISPA